MAGSGRRRTAEPGAPPARADAARRHAGRIRHHAHGRAAVHRPALRSALSSGEDTIALPQRPGAPSGRCADHEQPRPDALVARASPTPPRPCCWKHRCSARSPARRRNVAGDRPVPSGPCRATAARRPRHDTLLRVRRQYSREADAQGPSGRPGPTRCRWANRLPIWWPCLGQPQQSPPAGAGRAGVDLRCARRARPSRCAASGRWVRSTPARWPRRATWPRAIGSPFNRARLNWNWRAVPGGRSVRRVHAPGAHGTRAAVSACSCIALLRAAQHSPSMPTSGRPVRRHRKRCPRAASPGDPRLRRAVADVGRRTTRAWATAARNGSGSTVPDYCSAAPSTACPKPRDRASWDRRRAGAAGRGADPTVRPWRACTDLGRQCLALWAFPRRNG